MTDAPSRAQEHEAPWGDPPPLEPVEPIREAWARALCTAWGAKPDKIIHNPPIPRWRAWLTYADIAIKAAEMVSARKDGSSQQGKAND